MFQRIDATRRRPATFEQRRLRQTPTTAGAQFMQDAEQRAGAQPRPADLSIGAHALHLCVDMQRLFAEHTEWHTPWMGRVLPVVCRIAQAHPAETIFTRFIPAEHPGEGIGTWKHYYERWASMTIERLGAPMADLVPELAALVPPAEVVDKSVYSPWLDSTLERRLRARSVDTLVITGGETDVCVLATVLGAVDRGYRVLVVTDGLCSSSDEAHDASMRVYHSRYGQQVTTIDVSRLLAEWR